MRYKENCKYKILLQKIQKNVKKTKKYTYKVKKSQKNLKIRKKQK